MKTVKEVSRLAGVSIRTLRYYDELGLLKPTAVTEAGYRLYSDKDLERLQEILFFKEIASADKNNLYMSYCLMVRIISSFSGWATFWMRPPARVSFNSFAKFAIVMPSNAMILSSFTC